MASWEVTVNGADTPGEVRRAAERGLALGLEQILTTARQRVPIEEGTLERSGATAQQGLSGVVSFDTPYAVRQHEDLTMRHDAGRRAKYLESAMQDEADTVRQIVAQQIRDVVDR